MMLFYKGKSLIPCIAFHSLNNSLAAFQKTNYEMANMLSIDEKVFQIGLVTFFVIILLIYIRFSLKKLNK